MAWAKIKFYYDTLLGQSGTSLTATSTASGFDVNNLYSIFEVNKWMAANTTDPHYITLDTASAPRTTADCLIIHGHNLGTISASVKLQHSDDASTWTDAFTAEMLRSDKTFLKEFTAPGSKRYWRLVITGHTSAPYITILQWGLKTDLAYAKSSFDPHEQEIKGSETLSYGGYLTGSNVQYTERSMSLKFTNVRWLASFSSNLADGTYTGGGSITGSGGSETTLWDKVLDWWERVGRDNFFVAWNTSNYPEEVYLMRSDGKFSNPLKDGGLLRDITINLKGRKA